MGAFGSLVAGRVREETPRYTVEDRHNSHKQDDQDASAQSRTGASASYEVRRYEPYVRAVFGSSSLKHGQRIDSEGFKALAAYIGVFQKPANRVREGADAAASGEKIAMTAPVTTEKTQKIAMTAPVTTEKAQKIAMTAPVTTERGAGSTGTGTGADADSDAGETVMAFMLPQERFRRVEDAPVPVDPRVRIEQQPARRCAVMRFSGAYDYSNCKPKLDALLQALERDGLSSEVRRDAQGAPVWSLQRYNPPFVLPPLRTNEIAVELQ